MSMGAVFLTFLAFLAFLAFTHAKNDANGVIFGVKIRRHPTGTPSAPWCAAKKGEFALPHLKSNGYFTVLIAFMDHPV